MITSIMEQYFLNYNSLEQQRWMVSDRTRTDAFAAAIKEVVRPGDVVIDVGSGTGILAILAAKAGARRVIAVERSNMANLARELIEKNGLSKRIEVFHGDAKNLELDEPADVIISEWLGHMAYVENMFPSVITVRDRWLKPGGKLIPSAVDLMFAPLDYSERYNEDGPGFWNKKTIHGIDFSSFVQKELQMGHSTKMCVPNEYLLTEGKSIHHLETIIAKKGDEWSSGQIDFKIERDGVFNGIVGWFSTRLSSNVLLDTAPHCPSTHWEQTYFPYHPIKVSAGEKLPVHYHIREPFEDSRLMEIIFRIAHDEIRYIVE